MVPLTRQGTDVSSVFSLLGANENDLTSALGFALSRCSPLAEAVVARIAGAVGPRLDGFDQVKPQGQGTGALLSQPSQVRRVRNPDNYARPACPESGQPEPVRPAARRPHTVPSRYPLRGPGGDTRPVNVIVCPCSRTRMLTACGAPFGTRSPTSGSEYTCI